MALQTLDRAMAVLRLLQSHPDGLGLVSAQHALGLRKPTVHRLLTSMVSHGLVDQDSDTRRYRLGTALASLRPSRANPHLELARLSQLSVWRLAEQSGDTVFVMARDQLDTVCVARESGSYPIRAITVEVGTRRPLGVGAGGLSILGALPQDEARHIVAALSKRLGTFPFVSPELVLRASGQARRLGYALSDGTVAKGISALGVSIVDTTGAPVAAIGIAAIHERLRPSRVPELVALLREESRLVEEKIAHSQGYSNVAQA